MKHTRKSAVLLSISALGESLSVQGVHEYYLASKEEDTWMTHIFQICRHMQSGFRMYDFL